MPFFIFSRKRRQSDGANKPPPMMNVDVEPLPPMPGKFRSLIQSKRQSGFFSRSTVDLRRTAALQASDVDNPQHAARPIKETADVPSLHRDLYTTPSPPDSAKLASRAAAEAQTDFPDRPPLTGTLTSESASSDRPTLNINTTQPSDSDSVFHSTATSAAPSSAMFMTPLREEHSGSVEQLNTLSLVPSHERRASILSTSSIPTSPSSPRKRNVLLHSAPMPLPIANLPTLPSPGAHSTWGTLAREGGPKSPVLSRVISNGSNNGSNGFPWTMPVSPTVVRDLTDADIAKATRAMPVMLRVPSRPAPDDDGGEAEDDDSISDSEISTAAPVLSPNMKGKGVARPMSTVPEDSPGALHLMTGPSHRPQPSDATARTASTESQDGNDSDDESANASEEQDTASSVYIGTPTTPTLLRPPLTSSASRGGSQFFSHASRSMIDLTSPSKEPPSFNFRPVEPILEGRPSLSPPNETPKSKSPMPPLKRRLSAGDADPPPPKYEPLAFMSSGPTPSPREEEGRERLPPYWCGVHIEGTLSRKMEFVQPGVQAKDRAWKKYYFVLHGTALFVYKFDPSKVPLRSGEPYLTCNDDEVSSHLHVHPAPDRHNILQHTAMQAATPPRMSPAIRSERSARRNTISLESALRGTPISALGNTIAQARRGTVGSSAAPTQDGRDVKNPELFATKNTRRQSVSASSVASSTASAPLAAHMPFAHNGMLHEYTLQGAESGLAADYKKRLHCVRIRTEGQQFMLQTETARQCVQWIEAFQAASNVALDLDVRPMPVQQTLPRRRRRPGQRRPAPEGTPAPATFADTPEGNIAAVEAAERTARDAAERERDRMLAEDQAANTGNVHG